MEAGSTAETQNRSTGCRALKCSSTSSTRSCPSRSGSPALTTVAADLSNLPITESCFFAPRSVFASISQCCGKMGRSCMRQILRPFFVFGMSSGR